MIHRSEKLAKEMKTIYQRSALFDNDEDYEKWKKENPYVTIVTAGRNNSGQIFVQYEFIS